MRPNAAREKVFKDLDLSCTTLSFGGKLDIFTSMKLRKLIREFRPDIVQTWMSRAAIKTPRWSASMGIEPYAHISRLGGYYDLKYYKNTDYFVANTPDIRDYLLKSGVDKTHASYINNFTREEPVISPIGRAEYGVPQNKTLLIALGRLHQVKAFDMLIQAVAQMPDIYLWIAGEGPERAALEALIAELGARDRIRLLGWRSDRAELFAAADICVFPSRFEPFGNVFMQAWAQKIPLITTNSEGPRQYVRHEEDALVVEVDNQEQMMAAIKRLASDKSLAQSLVQRGYERFLNEFTEAKTVQAYLDLYGRLKQELHG
jgi:glycosyltransferase involved in cell wall biosynthesis